MRLNSAKEEIKEKYFKEDNEEAEEPEKAGDWPGLVQVRKDYPEKIHSKGGLDGNRK